MSLDRWPCCDSHSWTMNTMQELCSRSHRRIINLNEEMPMQIVTYQAMHFTKERRGRKPPLPLRQQQRKRERERVDSTKKKTWLAPSLWVLSQSAISPTKTKAKETTWNKDEQGPSKAQQSYKPCKKTFPRQGSLLSFLFRPLTVIENEQNTRPWDCSKRNKTHCQSLEYLCRRLCLTKILKDAVLKKHRSKKWVWMTAGLVHTRSSSHEVK